MLNSNAVHNLINWAAGILAVVEAVILFTGCTIDSVTGAYDCSASWLPPGWSMIAIAVMMAVKSIINIVRDGLGGLFKVQPPVASATQTVTVPVDVIAGRGESKKVDVEVAVAPAPTVKKNYNN